MRSNNPAAPTVHRPGVRSLLNRHPLLCLLLALAASLPLRAGGPLGGNGTTPQKYPSTAMPLIYRTDLGALGNFSNNVAVSIADYSFNQWASVTTASLSFTNAG